ncbi:MAG: hypothetical protein IT484_10730 [Gammaproteobacteria bacterium]|nr:hypothetical protein [Gammaproteobacteria bacterium]
MPTTVLRIALILIGAWLVFEAVSSLVSGQTVGREGRREGPRSVVRRADMPGYFRFLVVVRLVLGVAALAAGLLAP